MTEPMTIPGTSKAFAASTIEPEDIHIEIRQEDQTGGVENTKERIKEDKLGHRRIDRHGEVSYKHVPTNALMGSIQLGIANTIGSLASVPKRDILVRDFQYIQTVMFPSSGSSTTPSHTYGDFRFKTYAPNAFRYFRELFNIKPAEFLHSLCSKPLKELSNPGASGSIFYVSSDDRFIIKTIQLKEADFLRKLLSGYFLNLQQNKRTLLPKFFGLFCYQNLGKNIRLLIMNNLLPQSIEMHHKFDLKGSTYKRFASKMERSKPNPTLKDLDFNEEFKTGILLDTKNYDVLIDTIKRDCLVLESFKIMDYSLLIGVHNIELTRIMSNEKLQEDLQIPGTSQLSQSSPTLPQSFERRIDYWRSLQRDYSSQKELNYEQGVIPAQDDQGHHLLLYVGIIDILQNYRLLKKLEHTFKSIIHDGDTVSVTHPSFYAERFLKYVRDKVFRPIGQPGKFKTVVQTRIMTTQQHNRTRSTAGGGGGTIDQLATTSGVLVPTPYHQTRPAVAETPYVKTVLRVRDEGRQQRYTEMNQLLASNEAGRNKVSGETISPEKNRDQLLPSGHVQNSTYIN